MNKQQLISKAGRPFFRHLGILNALSLLALLSSPFISIWYDWSVGWKLGLSALIACLLSYAIWAITRRLISEAINDIYVHTANQLKEL